MLHLTSSEWTSLRSQTVILNGGRGQHRKFLPYAFTEQGLAMLSSVLRSSQAIAVNIQIMRAFVQFRDLLSSRRVCSMIRLCGHSTLNSKSTQPHLRPLGQGRGGCSPMRRAVRACRCAVLLRYWSDQHVCGGVRRRVHPALARHRQLNVGDCQIDDDFGTPALTSAASCLITIISACDAGPCGLARIAPRLDAKWNLHRRLRGPMAGSQPATTACLLRAASYGNYQIPI